MTIALHPIASNGCPGGNPVAVAVAPLSGKESCDGGTTPAMLARPAMLYLDEAPDREYLADLVGNACVVFEDAKRDIAALRRAGFQAPKRYGDLRLLVHTVDETRSRCSAHGEWQNSIVPLVKELHGLNFLSPRALRKSKDDRQLLADQAALRAKYLARLYAEYHPRVFDDEKLVELYRADLALVPVFLKMEREGVGCDVSRAQGEVAPELRSRLEHLGQKLRETFAGTTDDEFLNDDKLRKFLFRDYKVGVAARTRTREPSVAGAVLRSYGHKLLDAIGEFRELSKHLQFFRDLHSARLHGEFHLAGARTGRVYMRRPNLLGLPRQLRHLIVPAEGRVFIIIDYSQMELRVLAALCGDIRLTEAIRAGSDLHRSTAASVLGVAADAVTPQMRGTGKQVNFAIVYGQGAHGLAENLGITNTEAQRILDRHQQAFPGVWEWRKRVIDEALSNVGTARSFFGRIRHLPDLGKKPKALRQLVNFMVQSVAADICKRRLLEIADLIGDSAIPVLFAHDEVVLECPLSRAEEVANETVRIAERQLPYLDVPLRVEAMVSSSWAKEECSR